MAMVTGPQITPCLWFNDQAEAAARYYTSVFPDSNIESMSRYGENAPLPKDSVLVAVVTLGGQTFQLLNGGQDVPFTEAVSFMIACQDQAEVDHYWTTLSDGGSAGRCGWLKDQFGLSWQVVPVALGSLLSDPDPVKARRVMTVMLTMNKLVIADLQKAYHNG